MKKYFLLIGLFALTFGLLSCSSDDEGNNYVGYGYVEFAVNGTTYKHNDILGMSGGLYPDYTFSGRILPLFETPDVNIEIVWYYYTNQLQFKTATAGEYRIGDFFNSIRNLDLMIDAQTNTEYYDFVPGSGTHTVTKVQHLSTDNTTGNLTYLVEGTFSCKFKDADSGRTWDITGGKYWMKFDVEPESRI